MSRAILLLTLVGAVLLACGGVVLAQPAAPTSSQSSQSEKSAPDRVIVKLKEGAPSRALEERNRGIGARTEKQIAPHTVPGLHTVKLPQGLSVERAIEHYEASRNVEYAERDFFVYHDQTTINDPYYANGSLWGLNNTSYTTPGKGDIDAPEAWNTTTSGDQEIVLGVIDEGVAYDHPDLATNIWKNPKEEVGSTGVDDDGNGYVDDIRGWDFYSNDNTTFDGSSDDHGTHVAGTIGASGNNTNSSGDYVGVVGVNYSKVKIITAKFLGPNGGYTSGAIQAVDYLTDLKKNRGVSNLALTSNSWGGGGYSQGLYDAINRADAADILFVAAAGNSGTNNDSSPHYPSSYDLRNVISVAATDKYDAKSSFSNYGSTSVDLGAPGSGIYSTLPGDTYGSKSGTSMATPHVSGALALLVSRDPTLISTDDGHIQAKDRTLKYVDQVSSLSGKTVTGGRLNVDKALSGATAPSPPADQTTPAAPSNLTAARSGSRANQTINLTWTDQSSNEVNFTVERSTDKTNWSTLTSTLAENTTSYADKGVSQRTTYYYRVKATNSAGSSAYSNTATVTTK